MLVNGKNYFNEESLQEMKQRLEAGEGIGIHIDCIGHALTESETARYVEALRKEYGERLTAEKGIEFYTVYRLKEGV